MFIHIEYFNYCCTIWSNIKNKGYIDKLYLYYQRKRLISLSRNSSEAIQSREYLLYDVQVFVSETFFVSTENGNFCENIKIRRTLSFRVLTCRAQNPENVIVPCFNVSRMPNGRTSHLNRRQKTLYIHFKCISLLN